MLRIHFTPQDIAKTRLATAPDPMWETVFSVYRLRFPGPQLIFGEWRRAVLPAMRRADLEILRPLLPGGNFPDFLTPAEGTEGLEAGLEALMRTPKTLLRAGVHLIADKHPHPPSWLGALADGHVATLERLATAVRSQHRTAVEPIWPEVRAHIEADRAKRARAFLSGGCEGLLDSFRPMMRWEPPTLVIDEFGPTDPAAPEQSIHLGGRGLLLVPAYLSWNTPDKLLDDNLPQVLVYPVEHDVATAARARQSNASIIALIGATRAAVLESIGDGLTTTELARRAGTTPASISKHTAVLREARLIHTARIGKAVLHTLTPLGAALLEAG